MALLMKSECEKCGGKLEPQGEAFICTYECTFCRDCAENVLKGKCPNCGGEMVRRPRRPPERLAKHPASTERVFKPQGCGKAA